MWAFCILLSVGSVDFSLDGLTIRYASFRNSSMFCRATDGSMVGRASWLLRSSLRIGVRSVMASWWEGARSCNSCPCNLKVVNSAGRLLWKLVVYDAFCVLDSYSSSSRSCLCPACPSLPWTSLKRQQGSCAGTRHAVDLHSSLLTSLSHGH